MLAWILIYKDNPLKPGTYISHNLSNILRCTDITHEYILLFVEYFKICSLNTCSIILIKVEKNRILMKSS